MGGMFYDDMLVLSQLGCSYRDTMGMITKTALVSFVQRFILKFKWKVVTRSFPLLCQFHIYADRNENCNMNRFCTQLGFFSANLYWRIPMVHLADGTPCPYLL